jgi:transposase
MITAGNVADCTAGEQLLEQLPQCEVVNADKGYDSNALRQKIRQRNALANIPPKSNRKRKLAFSPGLYRYRNAIERMFCRLKDFRRIATRYDRKATNFLAAVCIAAAICYWL